MAAGRLNDRLIAGLLLALAVTLTWPVIIHLTWWLWAPAAPHSDLAVTHWPNAHFTRHMLWDEGRFPLWRPTIMSGVPFAANPLAGLYYPPNWLFLLLPWLPLATGFNLSALAHLWLAGMAMYHLSRRAFGMGREGAFLAAVAYEAAPKLVAHLGAGHVGWVQAWGWLPLAVLLWRAAASPTASRPARRHWAALTGVVLAFQFLADVRLTAYTLVAVILLSPSLRRPPLSVPLYLAGLTACQWLPLAALLPETTRSAMTFRDAAVWSLPRRYLAGLFLPDYGGFHEWMTYLGLVTLILAGPGFCYLWRRRGKRVVALQLAALLLGGIWFSLGENGGLFPLLYHIVPGLGLLRVPPRAWVLVVFAGAVLAGVGLEAHPRLSPPLLAGALLPLLLLTGYGILFGSPPRALLTFGLLPLPTVLLLTKDRRLPVIALLALDLVTTSRSLLTARPPDEIFAAGREAAAWLAARPGTFRVYSPDYTPPQQTAERYGLRLAGGVDPLQLRVYADYLTRAAGLTPQGYTVVLPPLTEGEDPYARLKKAVPDTEMLGQLGVRYIVSPFPLSHPRLILAAVTADARVYENPDARPLVEKEGEIRLADGTLLFRYDPRPVYLGGLLSVAALLSVVLTMTTDRRIHPTL